MHCYLFNYKRKFNYIKPNFLQGLKKTCRRKMEAYTYTYAGNTYFIYVHFLTKKHCDSTIAMASDCYFHQTDTLKP